MQRQVRQQRADIDSLYELTDQGFTELRERAGGFDTRIDALDARVEALDAKVEQGFTRVEQRFETLSGQLAEVLRQLRAE